MQNKRLDKLRKCFMVFIHIFFTFILTNAVLADVLQGTPECFQIENDMERLKCYDEIDHTKSGQAGSGMKHTNKKLKEQPGQPSYLSKLWDLDRDKRQEKYSIIPHQSSYFLPLSYNTSPNEDPIKEASPSSDVKEMEVKFRISVKSKLWQDILGLDMDLWFGYTQQSFWQLYNTEESSPFRETNYEPELLLNFRTDFDILGMKCRMITLGFNHQSNGRSQPLSRSWNRIVGSFGFEKESFTLIMKTWYRVPESSGEDDNPDTDDYFGYGEFLGYYFWNKHRFGAMFRNNLRSHDNRSALQIEWSFPLIERVSGYVQYFAGYGESLLDYNHRINRIGIGLILIDWN